MNKMFMFRKKGKKAKDPSKDAANARQGLQEDLFNDFYANRHKVYRFNFLRGIFFGFGSALGGTLVIALLVWMLSALGGLVPFLSDFIQDILNAINAD